jgi:hypothetical protein
MTEKLREYRKFLSKRSTNESVKSTRKETYRSITEKKDTKVVSKKKIYRNNN